jgi:flagellar export protein FliJ
MADFVFRAETVLELRRRLEDAARAAWGAAGAALERAERRVHEAERVLQQAIADAAPVHDPGERTWHRHWILRCRGDLAREVAARAERRRVYEAASARLNAAHRDVRALERLRERAVARWQLAERRSEQKELDWLGSVRYVLRDRES